MPSNQKDNKHKHYDEKRHYKSDRDSDQSCRKDDREDDKKYQKDNRHDDRSYRKDSHHSADVVQDANQASTTDQESDELIFIKDSCNIQVQTTDTQAAVSLQVGLQLAIALVLRVTIGDSDNGQNVLNDLLQHFDSEQTNKQKICIENSKDITITTTDTDLAVNIQALLEVLVTLVAKLDVL